MVQHIAFEVTSFEELTSYKKRIEDTGIEVIGPVNHGIFDSIYFFDPSGHRLELAVNKGTEEQMQQLKDSADEILEEWSVTKKAPRHASWLHNLS